MAVVIRLQGLPIVAGTMDIRHFFSGLTIPDGGVHIVGGEHGEAFIVFATDEDARLGMMRTGGTIKGSKVSLLLSSKTEMQNMIEQSRRRFETGNLDAPSANSGRQATPLSTGSGVRSSLSTTVQSFNSPTTSIVTTASSAHESMSNSKSQPSFSAASIGSMPNFSNNFNSPARTLGSTVTSALPPLNSVPPMPPLPTIPSLPPMPSIPPMPVPPPVTALPPVPPVAPIPPGPPVPPITHMPPLSGLPPFNPGVPPPVGPVPTGLSTSAPPVPITNPSHMFLGPLNPVVSINPQSHIKPPLSSSDELFVSLQGIPFSFTEIDVRDFFHGLQVENVRLLRDHLGRNTGRALIKFFSPQDAYEAMKRHTGTIGQRFVEVSPATERQWIASSTGVVLSPSQGLPKQQITGQLESDHIPRMRSRSDSPPCQDRARSRSPHQQDFCVYLKGLPYEAENKQVFEFFKKLDIVEDSIYIAYGPNGRATGEGFVEFRNEADYKTALSRHMHYMGNRFIQVHPISKKAMYEKIDSIRKRMQSTQPGDQLPETGLEKSLAKICAHISNIPYNIDKNEVHQFLEGIQFLEESLKVLVDSNGRGLGQAVVQFRSEEDALKAERLHRKKLNGRDAFVHLVTYSQMKEIEKNPPPQAKRGQQLQAYASSYTYAASASEEFSYLRANSGTMNNGPQFSTPFSASGNGFGAPPPPLPPLGPGLAEGQLGVPPPPVGSSHLAAGTGHKSPVFRSATGNNGGPSGYAGGSEIMRVSSFENGPRKNNATTSRSSSQAHLVSSQVYGSSGADSIRVPPGLSGGPGNPRPTVVKIQNMPFTVTIDEILDFFYGYQVLPGSVCLQYSEKGMPTGEAMVAFESHDEAMSAVLDLNDRPIGSRKVKLILG
ncbi:RNA-binding protein 12 [Erpetoichthys calabaricus]|uniref:RNA-binding protein 12 n=1 Tax=Erpetoichthys calabaricus TaxID=27687 RepID=UPI002234D637|nr:RNA-binding protein 12 [Erpetoichthys calabaricus]